ncbi:MAG: ABC transporter substrate-binding protein [Elusimicrobia bacterium]|nr:ABC transporter substrate-binding protein [Elusimicrobiota bacterium]
MRAIVALAVAAGIGLGGAPAGAVDGKTRIAVIMTNGEQRYLQTMSGISDALKEAGFGDSRIAMAVETLVPNKEEVRAQVTRLAAGADVVVPLGSVATQAAIAVVKEKPVVFGHVFNPVEEGIVKSWESPGANVTGGSNFVQLTPFVVRLHKVLAPQKAAILFTPGERQSESQLEAIMAGAKSAKLETVAVPVKTAADAPGLAKQLGGVDLLFLTGGTAIGSNLPQIVSTAVGLKIPTTTHVGTFIQGGVLLGLSVEPYEVGKIAGEALLDVLKGASPATVAVKSPLPKMIFNAKTAKAQGFVPPEALQKWITKTVE